MNVKMMLSKYAVEMPNNAWYYLKRSSSIYGACVLPAESGLLGHVAFCVVTKGCSQGEGAQ